MADVLTELGMQLVNGLKGALGTLGNSFVDILPGLIGAIILIAIGYIVGKILKQVVVKVLQSTRVDQWIDEQNLSAALGGHEISVLAGSLVKWWIIFVFLQQAVVLVHLKDLAEMLNGIVYLIPNAINAIIVIVAGLLIGRWIRNIVEATQHKLKNTVGLAVELVIVIFAAIFGLSFVLNQVNMNTLYWMVDTFIGPFVTAFAWVMAIVIGVGIGFSYKKELLGIGQTLKKGLK